MNIPDALTATLAISLALVIVAAMLAAIADLAANIKRTRDYE